MKHYETLGVAQDANAVQIRKAFQKLASKHHPDKASTTEEASAAAEKMAAINEAYDVLSTPEKRSYYDEVGDITVETTLEAEVGLKQCFMAVINHNGNLVDAARELILNQQQQASSQCSRLTAELATLNEKLNRFTKKNNGSNLLVSVFAEQAHNITGQIEQLANALKTMRIMLGMLDEYTDSYTQPVHTGWYSAPTSSSLRGLFGDAPHVIRRF